MKIVVLHSADALEPPEDPVVGQIGRALRALGHEAVPLPACDDVIELASRIRGHGPDLVFNIAESFAGKSALESNIAALLNLLDCRYTGSSPAGLLLAGDKALTKKVLRFHGLMTPEFATVYRGATDWAGDIRFPVIVKPPQEDGSIGIERASVVNDLKGLFERIDALQAEFHQPVLVEQYVEGREFYVGVLGNAHPIALPVLELDFAGFPTDRPRIASWDAKWGNDGSGAGAEYAGTHAVFAENLAPELIDRMQQIAVDAFEALRLRDYARIDLRVPQGGEPYIIEANPNCYLERDGEFARAAQRAGMEHDALIGRIVELATARYAR